MTTSLPEAPAGAAAVVTRWPLASASDNDRALARAVARAQRAYPELQLSPCEFSTHLTRQVGDTDPVEALDTIRIDELYLAFGAASGNSAAVSEFHSRYLGSLERVLARFGQGRPFADEVRQRLIQRLLVPCNGRPPRLYGYAGRGSLASWVATAARKLALDMLNEGRREAPLADALVARLHSSSLGPEAELLKVQHRQVIENALREAVQALGARDRQVLFLHLSGASFSEIGKTRGVDKSTVFHWFRKIRSTLRDAIEQAVQSGMTKSEIQSIVRLVQSQIDLGLGEIMSDAEL